MLADPTAVGLPDRSTFPEFPDVSVTVLPPVGAAAASNGEKAQLSPFLPSENVNALKIPPKQELKPEFGALTVNTALAKLPGAEYPAGVPLKVIVAVPAAVPVGAKVVCFCESPGLKTIELAPSVPTAVLLFFNATVTAGAPGRKVRLPVSLRVVGSNCEKVTVTCDGVEKVVVVVVPWTINPDGVKLTVSVEEV
jgi:hypothetical protein